jgi:DNA-binding MarR family transcriptional regulator
LTRAQWSVLAILASRNGLSQLADVLEIEKTNAGRLIDYVEKSGWVERRPIPGDRRLWGVYLTERAGPLITQVEEIVLSTRAEMLSGLSPQQQQELSASLQLVKTGLVQALGAEQSGPATQDPQDT